MTKQMTTVNSLSGGKTSSYIAVHYPADVEIFALVCIDDHNARGPLLKDKKLVQMVNDKLAPFIPLYGEFMATAEHPKTITAMFELEQMIGREIVWVRGHSFERIMDIWKAMPNKQMRFCTTEMKMRPIFEWLYMHTELPVKMRLGFRYDEQERVEKFTEEFKFAYVCWQQKTGRYIHRWAEIPWREGDFPLVDNKVIHPMIQDFWKDKPVYFPKDSNCQFCYWKPPQQLRANFDDYLPIMAWAGVQEAIRENTFHADGDMFEFGRSELDKDFITGTGAGCKAGFCTN